MSKPGEFGGTAYSLYTCIERLIVTGSGEIPAEDDASDSPARIFVLDVNHG